MDDDARSVVRDQAGSAGIHIVQAGWLVNDATGERLGTVLSRDADSMSVQSEGSDERLSIPTRLIAEEDEARMLATLAVGSDALGDAMPMDREDDPTPLT